MKKIIIIILFLILFISNIFFIVRDRQFPIKLMNCNAGYADCFVVSKHKDMIDCQMEVDRDGWYCDQTNPDNIQCRVPKTGESIATEYCSK